MVSINDVEEETVVVAIYSNIIIHILILLLILFFNNAIYNFTVVLQKSPHVSVFFFICDNREVEKVVICNNKIYIYMSSCFLSFIPEYMYYINKYKT